MIALSKPLRAAIGIIGLVVIVLIVMNMWGDFRSAGNDVGGSEVETTATPDATQTAPASKEGSSGGSAPAQASIGTVTVLVDGLNFRTEPSRDAELIRGLDAGEKLALLAEQADWLKVRDSANVVGYVSSSSQYTTVSK